MPLSLQGGAPQAHGSWGMLPLVKGLKPGSPRHNEANASEANDFHNLIVLCPNHHRRIDELEPTTYSAEALREIKARHEQKCAHGLPDDLIEPMLILVARRYSMVSDLTVTESATTGWVEVTTDAEGEPS